jgi:hypothetical protein
MRKTILCLVLLCSTVATTFAQPTTPDPHSRAYYLRKSGNQTAGAVLLTIVGGGLLLGAFSYDVNHLFDASASNTTGLYVAGLGCAGGSVALVVAAGRNRRSAREATVSPAVRIDHAPVPATTGIKSQSYPSLAISIKL